MQAAQRHHHQQAEGSRADHHRGVGVAWPAQCGVQRNRGRLGDDCARLGDAVGAVEHVLVGDEALAPTAADTLAEADALPAAVQRALGGEVLAEVVLAGAAAGAVGKSLVGAAQNGLDDHAVALAHRRRALRADHNAGHLVAGDDALVGVVCRQHGAEAGDVQQLEVGAADSCQGWPDQRPAVAGQGWGGDVARGEDAGACAPRSVVPYPRCAQGEQRAGQRRVEDQGAHGGCVPLSAPGSGRRG